MRMVQIGELLIQGHSQFEVFEADAVSTCSTALTPSPSPAYGRGEYGLK